jgi:hypothetical protein
LTTVAGATRVDGGEIEIEAGALEHGEIYRCKIDDKVTMPLRNIDIDININIVDIKIEISISRQGDGAAPNQSGDRGFG